MELSLQINIRITAPFGATSGLEKNILMSHYNK